MGLLEHREKALREDDDKREEEELQVWEYVWYLRPAELEEQGSLSAELWQELWFHIRTQGACLNFSLMWTVTCGICGEDDGAAGDLRVIYCAQRSHTANWAGFFIFLHEQDLDMNPGTHLMDHCYPELR